MTAAVKCESCGAAMVESAVASLGHYCPPDLALAVYRQSMRRDDGEKDRPRAMVDGAEVERSWTSPHSTTDDSTAAEQPTEAESRSPSGVKGNTPGRIRTFGLCLRRAALYPLSYGRLEGSV